MKTTFLLTAITSAVIFFMPSESLEAKSRVSFGVNVGTTVVERPVYYQPIPHEVVVVRRPAFYPVPVQYEQPVFVNNVPVQVVQPVPVIREEVVVHPVRRAVPRWYQGFSFNWFIK